ncbi:MAG: hypothetical protein WD276_00200 [Actinomycetota bacterium]
MRRITCAAIVTAVLSLSAMMPASAVVFQTDALIDGPNTSDYLGNNVYNNDGSQQTTNARVAQGKAARFKLRFQNDGSKKDNMVLKGCKGNRKFKVSYIRGLDNENDTDSFTSPGGARALVQAGISADYTLVIKVKDAADDGDRKNCKVTATSEDTVTKDAVLATVRVK